MVRPSVHDRPLGRANLPQRGRSAVPAASAGRRDGGFPVVLALVYVSALCAGIGAVAGPTAATSCYVGAAATAALWLAVRHPTDYVLFTIAIWISAPEIRRVTDWLTGSFNPYNLAAVAPYAVVLAGLVGLIGHPTPARRQLLGLVFVYAALAAGLAVGWSSVGPLAAGFALMEWVAPFIFLQYALTRDLVPGLLRRGLWLATLWIGLYGTLQYYVLPGWDRFWLATAPIDSAGRPVPTEFRVFSTLNSPGTMAIVLAVLVLILLATYRPWDLVALVPAFSALALSLVRASWLVIAVGVLLLLAVRRSDGGPRRGIFAALVTALLLVAVAPVDTLGPVGDRIATAGQLERDVSFTSRIAFFEENVANALLTPGGYGLGSTGVSSRLNAGGSSELTTSFDNGLLNIPFTLGWLGSALYVAGIALLCRPAAVRRVGGRSAPYGRLLLAAGMGLLFVNVLTGASGYFLGLLLALHLGAGGAPAGGDGSVSGPALREPGDAERVASHTSPRRAAPAGGIPQPAPATDGRPRG